MAERSRKGDRQARIYIIAGKEETLVSAAYTELINKLVDPDERALGLWVTDEKADITEVLDELNTLPFLAHKRVVAVRNADKFVSAHREVLEKYFDNPSPTGTLILTVQTWQSNTRLAKKLRDVGGLISVAVPKGKELAGRVIRLCLPIEFRSLSGATR